MEKHCKISPVRFFIVLLEADIPLPFSEALYVTARNEMLWSSATELFQPFV